MKVSTFEVKDTFCKMSGSIVRRERGSSPVCTEHSSTKITIRTNSFLGSMKPSLDGEGLSITLEGVSERAALGKMFEMMAESLQATIPNPHYEASVFGHDEESMETLSLTSPECVTGEALSELQEEIIVEANYTNFEFAIIKSLGKTYVDIETQGSIEKSTDFYHNLAQRLFNVQEVTPELRHRAKEVAYCGIYGGGGVVSEQ